jgi:hypothetical protein
MFLARPFLSNETQAIKAYGKVLKKARLSLAAEKLFQSGCLYQGTASSVPLSSRNHWALAPVVFHFFNIKRATQELFSGESPNPSFAFGISGGSLPYTGAKAQF